MRETLDAGDNFESEAQAKPSFLGAADGANGKAHAVKRTNEHTFLLNHVEMTASANN